MKTWYEWLYWLGDEEKKLAQQYPKWIECCREGNIAAQIETLEDKTDREVDAAVRHFAENGKWSHLSPEAGAMLRLRLYVGADLAEALGFAAESHPTATSQPSASESDMLEWFLIQLWQRVGLTKILGILADLRRGDTPDNDQQYWDRN